jgi:hypothetical protein
MKQFNSTYPCRRRVREKKRGAILIAALVCLAIVMGLLGSMLAGAIRTGRQLHAERDLRQCELLLAAGVDRAMLRLATEPDYRGETWTLPAAEMIAGGDGVVTIDVALDATQQPWPFKVSAEYPAGSERSIRRSRTILLPSKPKLE